MRRAALLLIALVALVAGCQAEDEKETSPQASSDPAAAPFELGQTLACLRRSGASVRRLEPADPELRALRDLAQRTSFRVRANGQEVGVAFGRDVASAQLLEELLTLPGSSYAVVRRGNVVVLYSRSESAALNVLADCVSE